MIARPILYFCIIALLIPALAHTQIGCEYKLEMYDSFGDGWNGGFLTVMVNGKSENYFLEEGLTVDYDLQVTDGDTLLISFTPGLFSFENSFSLFDAEGIEVFFSGQDPVVGAFFQFNVTCPPCPNLLNSGVTIENIRHDRALIRWIQNDTEGEYLIKIGPIGISPDNLTAIRLTGKDQYQLEDLDENSRYDVYLQAICSNGDTSNQIGPFTFATLWARDVGVEAVLSPVSGCDLPAAATIKLALKNYGGAPQSLIPYNYSVNGVPGAVNQPDDGFFTGILSYDSIAVVNFDATVDFSDPIAYQVKIWTELEGDNNSTNDTLTTTVVHTPLVDQFPYNIDFEDGAGGWMIDQNSERATMMLGRPSGNVIRMANSGENAWVTNLDGAYNDREYSILLSPCFDFSALEEDPELSFALWVSTEATFDGAWVEFSVNESEWTKLGVLGNTGAFWYNDNDGMYGDWWSGDNLFGGWRQVRHPMVGLAGESDVRIRFVFRSDEAVVREGIGIDDIFISPTLETNLRAAEVNVLGGEACGTDATPVMITFSNEGVATQENFRLAYQVNGQVAVSEVYTEKILPNTTATYTFNTTFNSTAPDEYNIKAWTDSPMEEYRANDTIVGFYSTAGPGIPFLENFESGLTPQAWSLDPDLSVENSHNSNSSVLFDNLWEGDTLFQAVTPILGPIASEDTLFFSYRFVDFTGFGTEPKILAAGDVFHIELSEDCGISYNELLTINAGNHQIKNTLTQISLPLNDYTGQWVKVRFRVNWGSGDYYFDLDNVNIRRCPESLALQTDINQPTAGNNGSIRIEAAGGIGAYQYFWNNGNRTASMGGLAPGTYEVTVSDQQGCTNKVSVILESVVGKQELFSAISRIRLAPNPNDGLGLLNVELKQAEDIDISVFDARGVLLKRSQYRQIQRIDYPVDLRAYANGVYFIRLVAGKEWKTVRLIKANVW